MTTKPTTAQTAPFQAAAAVAFPAQFVDLMTRSAQISPEAWREGCDLLASVAEDNARMLHELAKADTPLTAAALLAQYWQDMARKSFDHLVQTAVPQKA